MPALIQMSRKHPWRAAHPGAVIVDRRTRWGNPWRIIRDGSFMGDPLYRVINPEGVAIFSGGELDRQHAAVVAVEHYRNAIDRGWGIVPWPGEIQEALRGKDLACWCDLGSPCHADVLLALANA